MILRDGTGVECWEPSSCWIEGFCMCSISCLWIETYHWIGSSGRLRTDGKDFPEKPSHPEMAYNNPLSNHHGTNHVSPSKSWKRWKTCENVKDYIYFSKSIFFQTLVSIWTGAFLAFAASHCLNLNPFAQSHCPWALEDPQSSPGPVSAPCPAAGHATERSSWESRRPARSPAEQRGCSMHQYENGVFVWKCISKNSYVFIIFHSCLRNRGIWMEMIRNQRYGCIWYRIDKW